MVVCVVPSLLNQVSADVISRLETVQEESRELTLVSMRNAFSTTLVLARVADGLLVLKRL